MKTMKKFIYFCGAGVSGATVELGVFNLVFLFSPFWLSKIIALFIALSLNFIINRNLTFSATYSKKRVQIIRYAIVYSVSILVNFTTSIAFRGILGDGFFTSNLSVILGIIAGIPITFFGSLYWVFNNKE